ncbi:hypothetical protein BOX15_Mlig001727g2, partial [Macrostomum lignano]
LFRKFSACVQFHVHESETSKLKSLIMRVTLVAAIFFVFTLCFVKEAHGGPSVIPFAWVRQYGRLAWAVSKCLGKSVLPVNANKLRHIFGFGKHLFDDKMTLAATAVDLVTDLNPGTKYAKTFVRMTLTTGELVYIAYIVLNGGYAAIGTAYISEKLADVLEKRC